MSVTLLHDVLELTSEQVGEDDHLIDSSRLDCLAWPEVVSASQVAVFGSPGYRDALCECTGASATSVVDDRTAR